MIRKVQAEESKDGEVVERMRRARRNLESRFRTVEEFFAWAAKLDAKRAKERKAKNTARSHGRNR